MSKEYIHFLGPLYIYTYRPSPNSLIGRTYDSYVGNVVKLAIVAEMTILSQCYMVHDKSYKNWPETELRAPGRNVGSEQPVLCMVILNFEFQSVSLRTSSAFIS